MTDGVEYSEHWLQFVALMRPADKGHLSLSLQFHGL